MSGKTEILELRFEGNNISPSNVRPHEIAELIISFEKALLNTIKTQNPTIDTNQVLFSFEQIGHNSIDIQFVPRENLLIVVTSYMLISSSVTNGDYSKLDYKTVDSLNKIAKFSKKYDCNASFARNGEILGTLKSDQEIVASNKKVITEETVIYGEVTDAGGNNKSNVHLKINDDYILIFDTDRITSKAFGAKLYDKVKLAGVAKWDAETLKILEFKLSEILDYKSGNTYNTINELRNLSGGYWDRFNTNDEINNELLRD